MTSLWDKQKGQSEPLDKQFVESSVKVEVLIMLILLSVTLVPVRLVAVVLPSWAKSIVSPEPKPDPMASPEEPLTFISCSTSSDKDLLLPVLEWRSFEEMTGVLTVTLLFQSTVEFWSQFFTNPWIPLATSMISDPTSAIFSSLLVIPQQKYHCPLWGPLWQVTVPPKGTKRTHIQNQQERQAPAEPHLCTYTIPSVARVIQNMLSGLSGKSSQNQHCSARWVIFFLLLAHW